jgi:hypothetical protein
VTTGEAALDTLSLDKLCIRLRPGSRVASALPVPMFLDLMVARDSALCAFKEMFRRRYPIKNEKSSLRGS